MFEQEAREVFQLASEAKPLIARYVAQKLPYDAESAGWREFRNLVDKIKNLRIEDVLI